MLHATNRKSQMVRFLIAGHINEKQSCYGHASILHSKQFIGCSGLQSLVVYYNNCLVHFQVNHHYTYALTKVTCYEKRDHLGKLFGEMGTITFWEIM